MRSFIFPGLKSNINQVRWLIGLLPYTVYYSMKLPWLPVVRLHWIDFIPSKILLLSILSGCLSNSQVDISWWEIGNVRVTCPAQEHSVIVPAEAGRLSILIRNLFNALIGFKMDLSRRNQDGNAEENVD